LPAGAGVEDLDLQPHGASSGFHVSQRGLCRRGIARIDEHGNTNCCGHQLAQEFQPLCRQLRGEKIDPRQVAAWPGEAGDKTEHDRVLGDGEDDGIVVVATFAANATAGPPVAAITATRRRTRSAASAGSRSNWFSAQRYSIATFSPST